MPSLDLPLEGSALGRLTRHVVGGLVFMAVLAFALAGLAHERLIKDASLPRIVTLALPPAAADERPGLVADLVAVLERLPEAASVSPVGDAELDALLGPAAGGDARALSLPRLIDVAFNPGSNPDVAAIEERVRAMVPGATLGDGGTMAGPRGGVGALLRAGGVVAGCALLLAALVGVAAITRLSLAQHHETLDVLRSMGAKDAYVARQVEHHALAVALYGAVGGFVAAVLVLVAVLYGPTWIGVEPPIPVVPGAVDWVLLSLVPIVAVLLATLSARLAARFSLRRI